MRFSLEIELGNAEMQSFQDLRDALKQVATKLGSRQHCLGGAPSDGDGSKIIDANGNSVGKWEITRKPIKGCDVCHTELAASAWKNQFCPNCGHDSRS